MKGAFIYEPLIQELSPIYLLLWYQFLGLEIYKLIDRNLVTERFARVKFLPKVKNVMK